MYMHSNIQTAYWDSTVDILGTDYDFQYLPALVALWTKIWTKDKVQQNITSLAPGIVRSREANAR